MAKKWLKFDCENCHKENWIHEDVESLKQGEIIVYCCDCGYVYGQADSAKDINKEKAWLICLPFTGFERKRCRGLVGPDRPMTAETRWSAGDQSGQGVTRTQYMKDYGFDPWTTWCELKHNLDKKICQDDGLGRSYRNRCKSLKPSKEIANATVKRKMV